MKRRTLRALSISSLVFTIALAPVAFRMGKAQGGTPQFTASQIETIFNAETKPDNAWYTRSHSCNELGSPSNIPGRNIQIDCRPQGERYASLEPAFIAQPKPRKLVGGAAKPRRARSTPLNGAVAASVAAQGTGNTAGSGEILTPLSLAMAPDAGPAGGSSPSVFGSPTSPGAVGLPLFFTPGPARSAPEPAPTSDGPTITTNPDENDNGVPDVFDGPDTNTDPDIVTPVPAALPLMLTGLAGLMASARRKRQKKRQS